MPVLCFEWVAAISNRGPADEQMWVECGVESGAGRKRMVHASLLLPSAAVRVPTQSGDALREATGQRASRRVFGWRRSAHTSRWMFEAELTVCFAAAAESSGNLGTPKDLS
jgi:hypothetical protein